MPRYFFEIAYKGTAYAGWQSQPNAIGVQQVVEEKLNILARQNIAIVGSGRTDAGVHCLQQFFHADFEQEIDKEIFKRKINGLLPADISIKKILSVKPEAHARFDATARSYEYHLATEKNAILNGLVAHYFKPLHVENMNAAAATLLGEQDFASFSKVNTDVNHFKCTITDAHWKQKDDLLVFHISANRFLRGMVRAIVGTLLEVGNEKMNIDSFKKIVLAKDRKKAGMNAPPEGLFLTHVRYPESIFI